MYQLWSQLVNFAYKKELFAQNVKKKKEHNINIKIIKSSLTLSLVKIFVFIGLVYTIFVFIVNYKRVKKSKC